MPTFHLLIKGKVQGVFFRATAKETAYKLGVTGWVKNTPAGDVEAVVTGNAEHVQEFISWCRQGPRSARVTEVIVKEQEELLFEGFEVIR